LKAFLTICILVFCSAFAPENRLRIFLIGDSTCASKNDYDAPETGWGQVLPNNFIDEVEIQNHAINGRSTKSFRTEGRWKKVVDQLKKGDYVFIQFGHNDAKISDTTKYTDPKSGYRANLLRYVNETVQKGAIPILLTPIMRRNFDEKGQFVDTHGDYPSVMREVAATTKTTLIDLHLLSKNEIVAQGVEGSKRIFMHYADKVFPKFPKGIVDNTHFSPYGARLMANFVANELNKTSHPLKAFLKKIEFEGKFQHDLPIWFTPSFRKDTFDITRYGAKNDGVFMNTNAINQAIDMCNMAGGGTVLISKGIWISGPIVLKSNVNLHISKGALLQFSSNYDHYPIVVTTWEGQESYRCQAPIWAKNLTNIGITGEGILDGAGQVWGMLKKEKLTANAWEKVIKTGVLSEEKNSWYPSESSYLGTKIPNAGRILNGVHPTEAELKSYKDYLRPNMLSIQGCENVLIDGITLQNSPAWTMHPLLCEHISVKNVTVKNNWYAQNSDAIDLESCRNGILENCNFSTGDDGITIKSGRDEQGRKRGVPTENFIIKNNIVYHSHGGFVIGSEMSGGVRNLYVSDCTFMGSDVGLRFKTTRGRGGIVENIYVSNINMTNIPGEAIIFDMYYAAKDPIPSRPSDTILPVIMEEPINDGTPQFRDFYLKNIICKGAETGILIRGLPEMNVRNINIENAYIEANKGIKCIEAESITLKNVEILAKENTFATIQNVKNLNFDGLKYSNNTKVVFDIQGQKTKNISVANTIFKSPKTDIIFEAGLNNKVLKIK
jgi:DNA sulfur modification protein DndE